MNHKHGVGDKLIHKHVKGQGVVQELCKGLTYKVLIDGKKKMHWSEKLVRTARQLAEIDLISDADDLTIGEKTLPMKRSLIINKAEYGQGGTWKDVTALVRRQVKHHRLHIKGNHNGYFGDPLLGVVKALKVNYTFNGNTNEVSFPENATVVIPRPKKKKEY